MANAPHDASGKHCAVCSHKFTPASMTLSINWKENGIIYRKRVCGTCYNQHYSKGE